MALKPFGLGSTRYGVRLGSMAVTDLGNQAAGYALGQCANWGQGISPYTDFPTQGTGKNLPAWTAIPYLGPSSAYMFDRGTSVLKMAKPQDMILPRAQAADLSGSVPHTVVSSLGAASDTAGVTGPPQYAVKITSMMTDVATECMLAGIDRALYRAIFTGGPTTATASPSGASDTLYSVVSMYNSGVWITAADMFANNAIYAYIGMRDDADTVLGVSAYVNCALASLSYSFSVGSGITRSFDLASPWNVDFDRTAIKSWAAVSPRFRLTTPGLQLSNTVVGTTPSLDYGYVQANGGEFMATYGATQSVGTDNHYFYTTAADTGTSGQFMFSGDPSVGNTTANIGGWGFIPPAAQLLLGSPTASSSTGVYMPALAVGRDCFLDLSFYNTKAGAWQWASYALNSEEATSGAVRGTSAYSPTAAHPGGIARVQSFAVTATSRNRVTDEMGNRAALGSIVYPPSVSGTISILETDVDGFEQAIYQAVNPNIAYDSAPSGVPHLGNTPVTTDGGAPAGGPPFTNTIAMFDYSVPVRVNAVMTVATPGTSRVALMRFVVPNIKITTRGRRIQVNGVMARQYGFYSEDGGVASGSDISLLTGYSPQGALGLNTTAPPDGYGLKMGLYGGQTGGLAVQSFYVPAL